MSKKINYGGEITIHTGKTEKLCSVGIKKRLVNFHKGDDPKNIKFSHDVEGKKRIEHKFEGNKFWVKLSLTTEDKDIHWWYL